MTKTIPAASETETSQVALPPSSLIICSRNRPAMLLDTVGSVLEGDEVPTEMIIIDQSDQRNAELAALSTERPCDIRHLWLRGRGSSRARNDGIIAARHDLLALLDDDMYVASDWYAALIRALVDGGPGAVISGQVRAAEDVPQGMAPSLKVDDRVIVYQGRVNEDVLYTGNMALYREVVNTVGMFDERLGAGERFPASGDNDFGYRLLEQGYRIIYTPHPIVYHRAWRSSGDYLRLRWNYGRGRAAFYTKHLSLTDRYMLARLLADLHRHIVGLVSSVRHGRRALLRNASYLLGFCSGTLEWLLTERRGSGRWS